MFFRESISCFLLILAVRREEVEGFSFSCRTDGLYANPTDCKSYYQCSGLRVYLQSCPTSLYFNPEKKYCDWKKNVVCDTGAGPTTTKATTTAKTTTRETTTAHPTTMTTTSTTPTTTQSTETTPVTKASSHQQAPVKPFDCLNNKDGLYADPMDCSKYYQCGGGRTYSRSCPPGLHFSTQIKGCNWPTLVKCSFAPNKVTNEKTVSVSTSTKQSETSPAANKVTPSETCDRCSLPNCRCLGSDIPGGLKTEKIPMMVMLTFDDSVTISFYENYFVPLLSSGMTNPNGCPIKATFFVSDENNSTAYSKVQALATDGNEIASHSKSHKTPTTWWKTAGYNALNDEIQGMKERVLENTDGIKREDINGMRSPFLMLGGNAQYQVLQDNNFRYDSSIPIGSPLGNNDPPMWPFTLDVVPDIPAVCSSQACPTKSFPGLWEIGMNVWYGSNRHACSMIDGCTMAGDVNDKESVMKSNFYRHYTTNKAPLNIFLHAAWFLRDDTNFKALQNFLEFLSRKGDVWLLTVNQVLDWVQYPTAMPNFPSSWDCGKR